MEEALIKINRLEEKIYEIEKQLEEKPNFKSIKEIPMTWIEIDHEFPLYLILNTKRKGGITRAYKKLEEI